MRFKPLRRPLTFLADKLWPFSNKDQLSRLSAFIEATYKKDQLTLLKELSSYYPSGTKFVILPMDMKFQGAGSVPVSLEDQLSEIIRIREDSKWRDRVLPFVPADPNRENITDFVKHYVEDHGFVGVKLYPALGYWACDPRLFPLYEYCEENNIPITSHCSRGGVYYKGKLSKREDLLTHPITGEKFTKEKNRVFVNRLGDPDQFRHVLERYPNLTLNFAHYGGEDDWHRYLTDPWDEQQDLDDREVSVNWLHKINSLLKDPRYPNLYTDVSYTLHDDRLIPLLKMFLNNPDLRNRILFGTDYYMLEQDVAEREIAVSFRYKIQEEDFKQIAEANNSQFLGL